MKTAGWILATLLSSCVFGIYTLSIILLTHAFEIPHRYDVLFCAAVFMQIILILFHLEKKEEVYVIGIFHILGTCMELFKTHVGSWSYQGDGLFMLYQVPLFAGFMYASVGSAIARSIRLFSVSFTHLPKPSSLLVLSAAIYVNFFTHHVTYDIRYILLCCIVFLFYQTEIRITHKNSYICFRFLVVAIGVATSIWIAENIATYANIWRYPHQLPVWKPVHLEKITSWLLLMLVSFSLVALVQPSRKKVTLAR